MNSSLHTISLHESFSSAFYATAELFFRSQEVEMWQERGYLEMSQTVTRASRRQIDIVARLDARLL